MKYILISLAVLGILCIILPKSEDSLLNTKTAGFLTVFITAGFAFYLHIAGFPI